jgi:hypothetical protein
MWRVDFLLPDSRYALGQEVGEVKLETQESVLLCKPPLLTYEILRSSFVKAVVLDTFVEFSNLSCPGMAVFLK